MPKFRMRYDIYRDTVEDGDPILTQEVEVEAENDIDAHDKAADIAFQLNYEWDHHSVGTSVLEYLNPNPEV